MMEKYLLIRWPNGAEGAVLPGDFADEKKAGGFKGARVVSYEDGSPWAGPTTPEGMARKEEREEEAEEEKPAPRRQAAKD